MFVTDGGYSHVQFNNETLRNTAQRIACLIPTLLQNTGADAVVVTGKSGISLAFATLMLADFPIVVVRKRGENSHGNNIEGTQNVRIKKYIVLDDFVSTGSTVRTISREMYDAAYAQLAAAPECVGVLQYLRGTGDWKGMRGDVHSERGLCIDGHLERVPLWGLDDALLATREEVE